MKRTYQPSKIRRARTHGFPGPHEDQGWPCRDQRTSRQGPQASGRLRPELVSGLHLRCAEGL